MSAHRGWEPRRPGRIEVPTVLTGFPMVRTPATRRVRVHQQKRGDDPRARAARTAAWQAQQERTALTR